VLLGVKAVHNLEGQNNPKERKKQHLLDREEINGPGIVYLASRPTSPTVVSISIPDYDTVVTIIWYTSRRLLFCLETSPGLDSCG
jgi:hypothetical protein